MVTFPRSVPLYSLQVKRKKKGEKRLNTMRKRKKRILKTEGNKFTISSTFFLNRTKKNLSLAHSVFILKLRNFLRGFSIWLDDEREEVCLFFLSSFLFWYICRRRFKWVENGNIHYGKLLIYFQIKFCMEVEIWWFFKWKIGRESRDWEGKDYIKWSSIHAWGVFKKIAKNRGCWKKKETAVGF